jgi:hypothetical protein
MQLDYIYRTIGETDGCNENLVASKYVDIDTNDAEPRRIVIRKTFKDDEWVYLIEKQKKDYHDDSYEGYAMVWQTDTWGDDELVKCYYTSDLKRAKMKMTQILNTYQNKDMY